ncbi:MAG TPA: hypothetical protein VGY77_10435 [Gemmataceae bacterium]|nr:hypothetical protein [Gemmataceae bacterium]
MSKTHELDVGDILAAIWSCLTTVADREPGIPAHEHSGDRYFDRLAGPCVFSVQLGQVGDPV